MVENTTGPRVNGAMMSQHNGKTVVLLAAVEKVDPMGKILTVKTSDSQKVQVLLQQPIQGNLEGIVEVVGVVQGQQLRAHTCTTFPSDISQNFDMEQYDQAVRLIHTVPGNPWVRHTSAASLM